MAASGAVRIRLGHAHCCLSVIAVLGGNFAFSEKRFHSLQVLLVFLELRSNRFDLRFGHGDPLLLLDERCASLAIGEGVVVVRLVHLLFQTDHISFCSAEAGIQLQRIEFRDQIALFHL